MSKKIMTIKAAARIQSAEAKKNHGTVSANSFAARAQSKGVKNKNSGKASN
jgi:hypothetical protein